MKIKTAFRIAGFCGLLALALAVPAFAQDIAVYPQVPAEGTGVAYSPDGKRMATGGMSLKIWDMESGRELRSLNGHTGMINSVAYSPDGKRIVSGSMDKTVKIWDTENGRLIRTLSGHEHWVFSVAYSPDGKRIASGSMDKTVKIWDPETGRKRMDLKGHINAIWSVAYSPDGKRIASGSGDSTIKIWDAEKGKLLRTLPGHTGQVMSVAYSPDGKRIASGSMDKTVRIWDPETGRLLQTLTGHEDDVDHVAYSPDGKRVASGSNDKTARVWDPETGKELRKLNSGIRDVSSVVYTPDGRYITVGADDNLIFWDTQSGETQDAPFMQSNKTWSVMYSPDGKHILSAHGDKTIRIWDLETGRLLRTLSGHTDEVNSAAYSPNGKRVASGSTDKTIRIWEPESGQLLQTLTGYTSIVVIVVYSPDGKHILSAHGDNAIKIWDSENGRLLRTLSGHGDYIDSVAYSPDGKRIASGSKDKTIRIWDAENGRLLRTLTGHAERVWSVVYSPDGTRIASAGIINDETIRIWDAESGRELKKWSSGSVGALAYSPDGKRIVSGSFEDNTVKIWDAQSGRLQQTLTGIGNITCSIAFSPDGKQMVTGHENSTVCLWDISAGKAIAEFFGISGNDAQLASASRGLTVETQTAAASIDGEWLAITPDGFYQASPRGDRYLNVRANNAVTGIDAYRAIFYNPDVVRARLQGRPDPKSKANVTIQDVANFAPPTVTIQSPTNFSATNTTTTSFSVNITSQSQPVKNIKIIVNGRLIGKDELTAVKGANLQSERASLTVTGNQKTVNLSLPLELEPGNNRIEVVAFNGYSESRRYIDVTRNAPAGERPSLPNLWILAVGVNAYDNAGPRLQGLGNLNFCVADAKGLVDSLKAQQGKRYAKVNTLLIADGEAQVPTAANIKQGLKFLEGAAPRDVVVLFLAGHGISAQESKFFFLPKDAAFSGNKVVDASKAISGDEIMSVLDAPGNRLVFIDACQSGGVDNDRMVRSLMDTNAFVFAASRGNELSYEDPKLGHGYFTNSVMSALKGAPAALAQGNVSVLSMSGFVQLDVPRLTNDRQHPSAYSLGFYDFPMAVIK